MSGVHAIPSSGASLCLMIINLRMICERMDVHRIPEAASRRSFGHKLRVSMKYSLECLKRLSLHCSPLGSPRSLSACMLNHVPSRGRRPSCCHLVIIGARPSRSFENLEPLVCWVLLIGFPVSPKGFLRRQRSTGTALPGYDEEVKDIIGRKKPRYYDLHDSTTPPFLSLGCDTRIIKSFRCNRRQVIG